MASAMQPGELAVLELGGAKASRPASPVLLVSTDFTDSDRHVRLCL